MNTGARIEISIKPELFDTFMIWNELQFKVRTILILFTYQEY